MSCPGTRNRTQRFDLACCSCTTFLGLPLQVESFFCFIMFYRLKSLTWSCVPSRCDSPLSFDSVTSTCYTAAPAHRAHRWSFPQLCLPFVSFSSWNNPWNYSPATFRQPVNLTIVQRKECTSDNTYLCIDQHDKNITVQLGEASPFWTHSQRSAQRS